jgi:DNA-binding transcriptional LysR family regulator
VTKPNPLRRTLQASLCTALFCAITAQAHEGHHDEEPEAAPVATTAPPAHAAADTPQLELVAERRGPDVLLYLDDYATNAPLDGLQVNVHSGAQLLQAAAAGEGTYRIPGDLIDASKEQTLAVEVHGPGIEAQLQAVLPPAVAEAAAAPAPTSVRDRILAYAVGAVLFVMLIWALLRRRRGAA